MTFKLFFVFAFVAVAFAEEKPVNDYGSVINKLSLTFMKALKNETIGKNQCYSPLSLAAAVGMAREATAGETLTKLNQFFDNKDIQGEVSKIENGLKNSEDLKLGLANLVLAREDLVAKESFVSAMTGKFGAKYEKFSVSNIDEATKRVNDFVSNKTDQLIPKALDRIEADQVLILVNTVALDAKWKVPFSDGLTRDFQGLNGNKSVPFMVKIESMRYHHSPDHKLILVEVEYKGGLSMLILLPDERGSLTSTLTHINEADIESMLAASSTQRIRLVLPKFEIKSDYSDLIHILRRMGIAAFEQNADLSNLATTGVAFDSGVHKAVVKVDKEGTKAAASTVITVFTKSGLAFEPPTATVEVDHPFLFIIRHTETKSNLFVGSVYDI